jgi:hypothetical protein
MAFLITTLYYMPKTIAVDFDEVLSESMRDALVFSGGMIGGVPIGYEEIYDYELENIKQLQIDRAQSVERFDGFMNQRHDDISPVE